MATKKQRARRKSHARAHHPAARSRPTRGQAEAAVRERFTDDALLGFGADLGIDLTDRGQLLDAAAVGLTVLCWRNTSLEDVHAGVEAAEDLDAQLAAAPSEELREEVRRTAETEKRSVRTALSDGLDSYEHAADPAEVQRINMLLAYRERGFGIPDDVMLRLNVSTVRSVREVLDAALPHSIGTPGVELPYPPDSAPEHVRELVAVLTDAERTMTVGAATVTAGDVLGRTWDQYADDAMTKVGPHLRFADLLGTRRAVWHIALSGRSYARRWFPQRAWQPAVEHIRDALVHGRMEDAVRDTTRWQPDAADEPFWYALSTAPERLNGRQARWVMYDCRLDDALSAVRLRHVDELGGETPARFSSFMAHF